MNQPVERGLFDGLIDDNEPKALVGAVMVGAGLGDISFNVNVSVACLPLTLKDMWPRPAPTNGFGLLSSIKPSNNPRSTGWFIARPPAPRQRQPPAEPM